MYFLAAHGYRCIAHDRRGHGRSEQPARGNDMDTWADDLAELLDKLDVTDATLVGHSTGGGEVARYIGRHGTKRVSGAVLIGAVPPIMIKSEKNPGGLPKDVFDGIRKGVIEDRSQFFAQDLSGRLARHVHDDGRAGQRRPARVPEPQVTRLPAAVGVPPSREHAGQTALATRRPRKCSERREPRRADRKDIVTFGSIPAPIPCQYPTN